ALHDLHRLDVGAEQAGPGAGIPRLDHALQAKGDILSREGLAVPPLDALLERKGGRAPRIPPLPPLGPLPNALGRGDGINLDDLSRGRTDRLQASDHTGKVGIPHFRICYTENRQMAPRHGHSRSRAGPCRPHQGRSPKPKTCGEASFEDVPACDLTMNILFIASTCVHGAPPVAASPNNYG